MPIVYSDPAEQEAAELYRWSSGDPGYGTREHFESIAAKIPGATFEFTPGTHPDLVDYGWGEGRIITPEPLPKPVLRGGRREERTNHPLRHDWPSDLHANAGKSGLVLAGKDSYQTAFFEASFGGYFIRGEGESVADAEDAAWAKYQRYEACPGHEYETRGYTNGAGFCKHCGRFKSEVFTLKEIGSVCEVCGDDMDSEIAGRMFCSEHEPGREERRRIRSVARADGKPVNEIDALFDALTPDRE